MKAALKLDPGVLAYSAMYHKNNPAQITILETYASVRLMKHIYKLDILKSIRQPWQIWLNLLNLLMLFPLLLIQSQSDDE